MKKLFEIDLQDFRFEAWDEKPNVAFHQLHQTHSALVHSTPCDNSSEGDGIVGQRETLGIKTADCLPIALIGLQLQILADEKIKSLAPRSAFIGPCIHACCFEVTQEFQAHFPHRPIENGKFDLIAEAKDQIRRLYGIEAVDSGICTCCDLRFPSFRRDKTPQRIWNILRYQAK
jgi:copper oxidase (laccase) domain-containing protein